MHRFVAGFGGTDTRCNNHELYASYHYRCNCLNQDPQGSPKGWGHGNSHLIAAMRGIPSSFQIIAKSLKWVSFRHR